MGVIAKEDERVLGKLFDYGVYLGLTFQISDDLLDFEGKAAKLGKPALNDIHAGLTTLPMIYAMDECNGSEKTKLRKMAHRKYRHAGDIDLALGLLRRGTGLLKARNAALRYVDAALKTLDAFHDSTAKNKLQELTLRATLREF